MLEREQRRHSLTMVLKLAPSSKNTPCRLLLLHTLLYATLFWVPASKSSPSALLWLNTPPQTISLEVSAQTPRLQEWCE